MEIRTVGTPLLDNLLQRIRRSHRQDRFGAKLRHARPVMLVQRNSTRDQRHGDRNARPQSLDILLGGADGAGVTRGVAALPAAAKPTDKASKTDTKNRIRMINLPMAERASVRNRQHALHDLIATNQIVIQRGSHVTHH